MTTRTDRHGNKFCDSCGLIESTHTECHQSDILAEGIRKLVARGMASRTPANYTAQQIIELIAKAGK